MFLPDIYWCNRSKTEQFLDMMVDEFMIAYKLTQAQEGTKNKEIGLDVGKIMAKYQTQGGTLTQKEGTIVKSTSSLFKDLYTLLEAQNKIQKLVAFDEDIWNQLEHGEFLEVQGQLFQSPVELAMSSLIDFTDQYKDFFIASTSKGDLKKIELFSSLLRRKNVTIFIDPYTEYNCKFFTSLDTQYFMEDRYDLEGEFTILGKIKKIYNQHQSIDLIKLLPGKMRLPKENIKSLVSISDINFDVDKITDESFEIKGPAIELMPLAIYQS